MLHWIKRTALGLSFMADRFTEAGAGWPGDYSGSMSDLYRWHVRRRAIEHQGHTARALGLDGVRTSGC